MTMRHAGDGSLASHVLRDLERRERNPAAVEATRLIGRETQIGCRDEQRYVVMWDLAVKPDCDPEALRTLFVQRSKVTVADDMQLDAITRRCAREALNHLPKVVVDVEAANVQQHQHLAVDTQRAASTLLCHWTEHAVIDSKLHDFDTIRIYTT